MKKAQREPDSFRAARAQKPRRFRKKDTAHGAHKGANSLDPRAGTDANFLQVSKYAVQQSSPRAANAQEPVVVQKTVRCHGTFGTRMTAFILTVEICSCCDTPATRAFFCSPLTESLAHLVRVLLAQFSRGIESQFRLRRIRCRSIPSSSLSPRIALTWRKPSTSFFGKEANEIYDTSFQCVLKWRTRVL